MSKALVYYCDRCDSALHGYDPEIHIEAEGTPPQRLELRIPASAKTLHVDRLDFCDVKCAEEYFKNRSASFQLAIKK